MMKAVETKINEKENMRVKKNITGQGECTLSSSVVIKWFK
jgi:hypothetical protein